MVDREKERWRGARILTVENAAKNWIEYDGNVFRFSGGGTQFSQGHDAYLDQIAFVIPIGE